jgi:hypothetical protein
MGMDKFTLKHEWVGTTNTEHNFTNTTEFSCEGIGTVLERIEDFLKASGFSFDGRIDIVKD